MSLENRKDAFVAEVYARKCRKIDAILSELASLACPGELPKSFSENCKHIWKAFELGREYHELAR